MSIIGQIKRKDKTMVSTHAQRVAQLNYIRKLFTQLEGIENAVYHAAKAAADDGSFASSVASTILRHGLYGLFSNGGGVLFSTGEAHKIRLELIDQLAQAADKLDLAPSMIAL